MHGQCPTFRNVSTLARGDDIAPFPQLTVRLQSKELHNLKCPLQTSCTHLANTRLGQTAAHENSERVLLPACVPPNEGATRKRQARSCLDGSADQAAVLTERHNQVGVEEKKKAAQVSAGPRNQSTRRINIDQNRPESSPRIKSNNPCRGQRRHPRNRSVSLKQPRHASRPNTRRRAADKNMPHLVSFTP